jgi:hypothetical protein
LGKALLGNFSGRSQARKKGAGQAAVKAVFREIKCIVWELHPEDAKLLLKISLARDFVGALIS